jgi:hypothetical protein
MPIQSSEKLRRERLNMILKTAKEKRLTETDNIDDLVMAIYPFLSNATQKDYSHVIRILLKNGVGASD